MIESEYVVAFRTTLTDQVRVQAVSPEAALAAARAALLVRLVGPEERQAHDVQHPDTGWLGVVVGACVECGADLFHTTDHEVTDPETEGRTCRGCLAAQEAT